MAVSGKGKNSKNIETAQRIILTLDYICLMISKLLVELVRQTGTKGVVGKRTRRRPRRREGGLGVENDHQETGVKWP